MFDRLIFDSGKFNRETNDNYEGYIHGEGELDCAIEMVQFIGLELNGSGEVYCQLALFSYISGSGEIIQSHEPDEEPEALKLNLVMNMEIKMIGSGGLDITGLGDAEMDLLYLRGISLLPNQTITIDADSMTVLFGLEHDVSSLTGDSVFFELAKGINELNFEIGYEIDPDPMPANEVEVTAIWQNRWL